MRVWRQAGLKEAILLFLWKLGKMGGKMAIKAGLFSNQTSIYVSEKPSMEGAADSTLRAYLDCGVKIVSEGAFFEISAKHGDYKASEILLCPPAEAQNIFSGKITSIEAGIFFMPAGWRTYSHCCAKCGPSAWVGKEHIQFMGESGELKAVLGSGGEVSARLGPAAKFDIAQSSHAIVKWGKSEATPTSLMAGAKCSDGAHDLGPAMAFASAGAEKQTVLLSSGNPAAELELPEARNENPANASKLLIISPESFSDEAAVFYFLPRGGKVRLELSDLFGFAKMALVDETAAAGGHQIRIDGTRLSPGPYKVEFSLDGKTLSHGWIMRKF
jgi:hypothetical protein